MSTTQSVILIIAALAVAILIIWLFRSRTDNAGEHVDTSVTAVGAAAEAVRNVTEDAAQVVADSMKADVRASGARAEDGPAEARNAAAIMASGGAAAGAVTLASTGSGVQGEAEVKPLVQVPPPPAPEAGAPAQAPVQAPATPQPAPVQPAARAPGGVDNLRQMKGIGPKLASLLTQLGITRFDQIAAWDEAQIDAVDAQLGTFKGRIRRDNWVEQARFLASGDIAGFEAKFGKLDKPA